MFTEKSLITEVLREAAFAASKDELTGFQSNTCPINSVCKGSGTKTAATAPVEESVSGHLSTEPRHGEETNIILRGRMNSLYLMLQPMFSHWKCKGASVTANWIQY